MRLSLCSNMYGFRLNPTIILLSGAYSNSEMWPRTYIHGLVDRGFHVMTLDHRDCGRNYWNEKPFSMEDMVDDVYHTMVVNRLSCPHIIGASMGGAIALRFAIKYPDACKTLVLHATTPGKCFSEPHLSAPSETVLRTLEAEQKLFMNHQFEEALTLRYKHFSNESDEYIREKVNKLIRSGIRSHYFHGKAFLDAESIVSELKNIEQNTLIMHGENDEIFPLDHAWKLHHEIPNSKLYILQGVNHHIPNDINVDVIANYVNMYS